MSTKTTSSRLFGRTLARELSEAELLAVSGGVDGYCWICERSPVGGGGADEKVYSPD